MEANNLELAGANVPAPNSDGCIVSSLVVDSACAGDTRVKALAGAAVGVAAAIHGGCASSN